MKYSDQVAAALERALEQRICRLFEVLVSEGGAVEAFGRFERGLELAVATYDRTVRMVNRELPDVLASGDD